MRHRLMVLLSGTILGQLITIGATPILSRLYDPAAIGTYSVVVSIATILASVISLRLERAVALPKSDEEAAALASLALRLILVGFLLSQVVCTAALGFTSLQWLVAAGAPVTAALIALVTLLTQLAIRDRRYASVSRRAAVQPLAIVGLQVAAGALMPSGSVLVAAGSVGRGVGVLGLLRSPTARLITGADRRSRASAWGRYKRVSLLGTVAGVLNTASIQIPVVLVAALYGLAVAGQFSIAILVVSAPILLVGNAVGQAFLGELAHLRREGAHGLRRLFVRFSVALTVPGLVGAVIVYFAAPFVLDIVLGPGWSMAAQMAGLLSVMLSARFVAAPLAQTLVVFEKQGTQVLLDGSRLLAIVSALVVSALAGLSPLLATGIFSVVSAGAYVLQWILCLRAVSTA